MKRIIATTILAMATNSQMAIAQDPMPAPQEVDAVASQLTDVQIALWQANRHAREASEATLAARYHRQEQRFQSEGCNDTRPEACDQAFSHRLSAERKEAEMMDETAKAQNILRSLMRND